MSATREFTDAFAFQHTKDWTTVGGAVSFVSPGLDGVGVACCQLDSNNGYLERDISSLAERFYSWLILPLNAIGDGDIIFQWMKGTTILGDCRFNAARKLEGRIGTTLTDTGDKVFNPSTTYWIEAQVKIHDSTGIVKIWVDGVLDIDISGDTKPGSDADQDRFRVRRGGSGMRVANVMVDSAVRPGNHKFYRQKVGGDTGTYKTWDASSGSNHAALVDEDTPNGSTDYVKTDVTAEKESFVLTAHGIPSNVTIVAAHQEYHAQKSGSTGQLKVGYKDGGTEVLDSAMSLPISWGMTKRYSRLDNSGNPWTRAKLDALELLVESLFP